MENQFKQDSKYISKDKISTNENGIWYSLAFHFFVFSIFILQNVFFEGEKIDYESAIRVDIVGLPDKLIPTPQETSNKLPDNLPEKTPDKIPENHPEKQMEKIAEKLPEKKPVPDLEAIRLTKEKQALDAKANQKKQVEAIDKIKKISAIDKIKSELESEQTKKIASNQTQNKFQYKGSVLNPGTELTGLNKLQHENYVALLDKKIKENWTLPQWLSNKDLTAQALIKIDENGVVIYNQIFKTSGNTTYDDFVLETIHKSSPFPKPPEKFLALVGVKGILIGFPE